MLSQPQLNHFPEKYKHHSVRDPRLQKYLYNQTEVQLAPKYLSELMKKHDIVYRGPKHDLSDKQQPQEVEEKKQLLEFLKKTHQGQTRNCISLEL